MHSQPQLARLDTRDTHTHTHTHTRARARAHAGELGEASTVHHSDGSLAVGASLLCVGGGALGRALTSHGLGRRRRVRPKYSPIRLRPTQAAGTRDALAKGLYSRMSRVARRPHQ